MMRGTICNSVSRKNVTLLRIADLVRYVCLKNGVNGKIFGRCIAIGEKVEPTPFGWAPVGSRQPPFEIWSHLALNRRLCRADTPSVAWWEWVVVSIWGPATVAVIAMLCAVGVGKARTRLGRRKPVLVDRRQPERAWLREAIDGRGVSKSLSAVGRELEELTAGDRRLAEDIRRSR
jgi:hypothetical protein